MAIMAEMGNMPGPVNIDFISSAFKSLSCIKNFNATTDELIDYVVQKTDIPRPIVDHLSQIELDKSSVKHMLEVFEYWGRPGALALSNQMVDERLEYLKEGDGESPELDGFHNYLKRLQDTVGVSRETAIEYNRAMREWLIELIRKIEVM